MLPGKACQQLANRQACSPGARLPVGRPVPVLPENYRLHFSAPCQMSTRPGSMARTRVHSKRPLRQANSLRRERCRRPHQQPGSRPAALAPRHTMPCRYPPGWRRHRRPGVVVDDGYRAARLEAAVEEYGIRHGKRVPVGGRAGTSGVSHVQFILMFVPSSLCIGENESAAFLDSPAGVSVDHAQCMLGQHVRIHVTSCRAASRWKLGDGKSSQ